MKIIWVLVTILHPALCAPNVVFVLMDDVGWADFGYNVKGNRAIVTPNLDRLAGQGLRLGSHYVQSSCTPSRASLMTGR